MNHIDKQWQEGLRLAAQDTRGESHTKSLLKPGTLNARVVGHLKLGGSYTRAQLCATMDVLESSMCGRLNDLVKQGWVEVGPVVYNEKTRRNVVTYRAAP